MPSASLLYIKTKSLMLGVSAVFVASLAMISFPASVLAAACQAPSTDYGSVNGTVNIPAAATYRIWSRIMAPNTTDNSYLLEVDGAQCYNVGGSGITAGTWTWVAHKDGNTGSKIDVSLTQGSHTIKMIGNKPDVKLDRLVFASDLACVPTGDGSNCNTPSDSTVPTVRITAPAADAGVSGKVTVSVTASDNVSVSKVELYVNSVLLGTDTGAPYSFDWDTTTSTNDAQQLMAKAYDGAGNVATDSLKVTVQNGDKQAPTVPSGLTGEAPAYNKVALTWKASTDNVGVSGYTVLRDTVPIGNVSSGTTYTDTPVSANTSYTYQVLAYDAAGNKSANSASVSVKTPVVVDVQPPSTPPAEVDAVSPGSSQVNLTWGAGTDNTGIVAYDVYRSDGGQPKKIATVTTNSFGDTNLKPGTDYSYYVVAKDGAGNTSQPSGAISVTTKQFKKRGAITGVIRDAKTKRPLAYAAVVVRVGAGKHIYQANKQGQYTVRDLEIGRYNNSYRASKYYSKTFFTKIADNTIITKDVALQKR